MLPMKHRNTFRCLLLWLTDFPADWQKSEKNGELAYLRPDGKTQVTVEYEDGKPVHIDTTVISAQHNPEISLDQIKKDLIEHVIKVVMPADFIDDSTKYLINPTGRFVIGGPQGDAGLTGRKIIVDTYGGMARHGGGCFSGKDPTKVDRSAAYAARYVAKILLQQVSLTNAKLNCIRYWRS